MEGTSSRRTLLTLCLVALIVGANLQLLPASMRAMELDLGLWPSRLATLALCQGVTCSLAGPVWACLIEHGLGKKTLLATGALLCGLCLICLSFASSMTSLMALKMLNGASIAMVFPVTQVLVTELGDRAARGFIFGLCAFSQDAGQFITGLVVTPLATSLVWGIRGWRIAAFTVGVLSALFACGLSLVGSVEARPVKLTTSSFSFRREVMKVCGFFTIPSFRILVFQGFFGTIPSTAMSWSYMYLQYIGFPPAQAGIIFGQYGIGTSIGNLLGGIIGDRMSLVSPIHGRAFTAQLSMILALPLVFCIFVLVPVSDDQGPLLGILFLILGVVSSWVGTGCIRPIMSEIIPRDHLPSAYAWELGLVFFSGNIIGPTLTSKLAEGVFGYRMSQDGMDVMPWLHRYTNATALGFSIFWSTLAPWVASILIFGFLHFTYEADAKVLETAELPDVECTETTALLPGEPMSPS